MHIAAHMLVLASCRDTKLHATVVNTRHRRQNHRNLGTQPDLDSTKGGPATPQSQHQQPNQRYKQRTPFDGRWLLANHGDLDLGVQQVSQVHLSQRGQYEDDGYYKHIDKLSVKPVS